MHEQHFEDDDDDDDHDHDDHDDAGEADAWPVHSTPVEVAGVAVGSSHLVHRQRQRQHQCNPNSTHLDDLPNEILLHILGYLDVNDLLFTSRVSRPWLLRLHHANVEIGQVNRHFRSLSLAPILHAYRLRHARIILRPLLASPSRPTLTDLISKSIFLTHTTVVSRRLARSLVSIRLSRRLACRPTVESLVQRAVLPPECVPPSALRNGGGVNVAPALVARRKAAEKERVKDELRGWVRSVWRREVGKRAEPVRRRQERFGIGRVWRLRRFWERIGRGEEA